MSAAPAAKPPPQEQAPDLEYTRLSKHQKLAILLLMLGAESAARILKELDDEEVEAATAEMANLGMVSQELQTQVLREFGDIVVQTTAGIRGSREFAQTALEKGLGATRAVSILNRVAPLLPTSPSIKQIAELEPDQIFSALKNERAQTIALVTSCLGPTKASQLLSLLPTSTQEQVVERLATLGTAHAEAIEHTLQVVLRKCDARQIRPMSRIGGVKAAATVLNALNKKASHSLLTSLEQRNPQLSQAIREKMFTFEDLARLDSSMLQRILREIDMRDLALALKIASEQLKNVLLGCISKRAAETLKEEMSFMGSVKVKEAEGAQLRIMTVLRHLESEGEIDLSGEEESANAAVA